MADRWGVQIHGSEEALEFWLSELKPPFHPCLELIKDERGDYVVLRSRSFEPLQLGDKVDDEAQRLIEILSISQAHELQLLPLSAGAVVEFLEGSSPRKMHFLKALGLIAQPIVGSPKLRVFDPDGRLIAPEVGLSSSKNSSKFQRWAEAASIDARIGSAIEYLRGNPGWIEYYKVYEALNRISVPDVAEREKERLRLTANVYRHHKTSAAPAKPMTLNEARGFVRLWLEAAIDHVLVKQGRERL